VLLFLSEIRQLGHLGSLWAGLNNLKGKFFLAHAKIRTTFEVLIPDFNLGRIYTDRFHKCFHFPHATGLVVGLLSQESRFNPRPFHAKFVVDNLLLG